MKKNRWSHICKKCKSFDICKEKTYGCDRIKSFVIGDMLDEIKGFYRVFNKLAPISFLKTDIAEIGLEKFKENEQLFIPCMINGLLAAELSMKLLIYKETYEFVTGHNLDRLFKSIPQSDRDKVMTTLQGKYSEYEINTLLEKYGNDFVVWRYPYEKMSGSSVNIFTKDFISAVCEYALDSVEQHKAR